MNLKTTKHLKFNKIGIFFLVAILFALMTSCTAERELAREFVKTNKDIPVLLLSTDRLILTNEKLKKISNFDSLDVAAQDSIWLAKTIFLDSVNDAKLLQPFYLKMKTELQLYGFRVYEKDSVQSFNALESPKYTLNIAQVEMSEDDYLYRDEEVFSNSLVYYQDHTLNVINLNFWFEFSSSGFKNEKVFYSTFPLSDQLESRFVTENNTNNVTYQYKITPVGLKDIYQLSEYSAQKSSNYLFNYLMNKYIKDNLPANVIVPKYFSYDRYSGFIFNNENDQFEELDKE